MSGLKRSPRYGSALTIRHLRLALFWSLAILAFFSVCSGVSAFTLDAGDRLKITVLSSRALSGPYLVQADGSVALPTGDNVNARGLTAAQLASAIREALANRLPSPPAVSVEIVEFRPVLVVGDVRAPGPVPFIPGVTVAEILSLAGGRQLELQAQVRTEIEVVNADEAVEVLRDRRIGLLISRARLIAEKNGADFISFPSDVLQLADNPKIAGLVENEESIFTTRAQSLSNALLLLDEERELLKTEIASLDRQLASERRRAELLRDQEREVNALVEEGFAARNQKLDITSSVTAVESSIQQLQVFRARALQGIAQVEYRKANLQRERAEAIVTQLQAIEQSITEIDVRLAAARLTAVKTRELLPSYNRVSTPADIAIIRRDATGKRTTLTVDESAPVQPGDIIRIDRKQSNESG